MSSKEKTFNVLPGSDSDEDDICSGRYSERSVIIQSWKPASATRLSSGATRKVKDLNLSDVSADLPVSLQKNLSLMSDKVGLQYLKQKFKNRLNLFFIKI